VQTEDSCIGMLRFIWEECFVENAYKVMHIRYIRRGLCLIKEEKNGSL